MIVAILALLLTMVVCVAGAISVMLVLHTLRIRAAYAIPAMPLLVPTVGEQIPPDLADFLAQVVPALHELGFVAVASVHAPQLLVTVAWTQVLFLRRDRGDRASVMLLRPRLADATAIAALRPALFFATELEDGRSVKTATQDASSTPTPLHDRVATLYAQHRADVGKQLGDDAVGIAPAAGDEIVWLQARAGAVASTLAEQNGFIPLGSAFYPPWGVAIRAGWKAIWARRKALPPAQGFAVVAAPANRR
jgi:hypothetical protein